MLRYPVPWDLVCGLTPHLALGTRRNVADFTARIVARMHPPQIEGAGEIPPTAPFVLVANHYQRKGLWILHTAAAITQAIAAVRGNADPPVRWLVTANWPPWRLGPWRFASPGDLVLPRVAHALSCCPVSFASSNPAYTAASLKRLLHDARVSPVPVGVFPEGVAGVAGQLTAPLPGVGRLLQKLRRPVLPCGVSEDGRLVLRFGSLISTEELAAAPEAAVLALGRVAQLIS